MANAAEWVTAAENGLGWEPGTHIADLDANRRNAIEASVENEPVVMGILELDFPWTGTASRLRAKLSGCVPGFPKTANSLGNAMVRITPIMAEMGVKIERRRSRERSVTISRIAD